MTKTTHDCIRDLCRGYHERRREIEIGDKGRPSRALMIAEFMRINAAIDHALLIVPDESLRDQIRRSLIDGAGFNALPATFCGYNQFYAHKRRVATEIARNLHLTE